MRKALALTTLFLAAAPGCIVYETDGWDCGEDSEFECRDDWGLEDTGADVDEEIPVELSFHPNHAEQGETLAAVIRLDSGELDLTAVSDVSFFGDVVIDASVAEADRITVIITIPEDAELGSVDLVLELQDGGGEVISDALEIFPAGSGNSGTSDSGSGTGSDGSGSGDGSGSDDGDCE
ncbi:MAG: hypothetical protein GY913_01635 [Proteobacteria bacterium]|nr:hypothetical protein [Pseudomonadota bacterium]MCP4915601.1 hypothetical protein [Pseudomonadota bacterium]